MNLEKLLNFYSDNKKPIKMFGIFFLSLIFFLFLVIFLVFVFGPKDRNVGDMDNFSSLPGDLGKENAGVNGDELNGIRAEDIMFGHFYEKSKDNFRPASFGYDLPVNVKTEVENYHDVSRKINLSEYVDDLNEYGFKIIDNPFPQTDDFFSLYNKLLQEEIPIVITSDFLMYYYQNNLKNIFDEIERNTFYKNVWDIYKDLFDTASRRYEERLSRLGISNDPVLEGERLETAYLAIVLKLLTPNESQIAEQKSLNSQNKFSRTEAMYYDFNLPEYLERDVGLELKRISEFRGVDRSPVFLYSRNYQAFVVPREYKEDAKLYNFYLATRWLNSPFPLYFRSDNCPDCLLDKNDWLINMTSASFLAKDMSNSQSDKNKWAIIYKFLSYFSGLRQDLTYLEYNGAFEDVYGQGYIVENVFSRKNFSDVDIYKIQKKIAENKFSEIEGSYSRIDENKYLIGMRMLQDSFWPNDYIFKHLTGKEMVTTVPKKEQMQQTTSCQGYRCRGVALDVFNLSTSLTQSEYFLRESKYTGYEAGVQYLRNYMAGFNVFTWNTNVYWSTLDILNINLSDDKSRYPAFMRTNKWFNDKELNMALGSWANIHVPKDIVSITSGGKSDFNALRPVCSLPNYIEPSLMYLHENVSRNNMLLEMMDVLNVSRDTNLAALDIGDVNSMFEHIIEINEKVLSGSLLNYNDCMYIRGLVKNKKINNSENKSFTIELKNGSMRESMRGVKLMILVFNSGDDKIIAMGPVYDYKESYH